MFVLYAFKHAEVFWTQVTPKITSVADEYFQVIQNIMPIHDITLSRPLHTAEVVSFSQGRDFCCW